MESDIANYYEKKKKSNDIEAIKKEKNNVYEINKNGFDINIAKKSDSMKLVNLVKDKYELSWNIEGINSVKANIQKNDKKKLDNEIEKAVENKFEKLEKDKKVEEVNELDKEDKENIIENKKVMIENEKKKSLTNISSGVKFNNVFNDIDLEYKIISDTVKENIIINNKIENRDVEFDFNISVSNLIVKQGEDKKIYFYDKDDSTKIIFVMESPFMYDSKGEESKKIELSLIENSGVYSIKMIPDKEWLNDKDRSYPIVIDPVVQTSQNRSSIMDTFTRGVDVENKYNNIFLRVGNNSGEVCRSYIKFSIPELTSAETIIKAELALNLYDSQGTNQINVHKVLNDWNANSTSNLSTASKPGYSEKIEDYSIVSGKENWQSWDITSIAKEWYNTGNNFGLMLKSNNETTKDSVFWASDLHDAYTVVRPMVAMQYISNSCLEDYFTYNSQSAGRAGNGYISDHNGNLVYIHDDISGNGNRMPVKLSHVYNSNQKNNNDINGVALGYGNGWRLNLSQRVFLKNINNVNYYTYIDGDGTYHYFKLNDTTGKFEDELDSELVLETNYDNGYDRGYLIKDKKDNKILFTANGYLYKLIDSNDNAITLSYEGTRLKYIYDGVGRKTTLNINSSGYLVDIIEPDSNKTSFTYNGTQLASILYPDGKSSKYIYDSNNNLKEVVNIDGYKIKYDYYDTGSKKVKKTYEVSSDGTIGKSLDLIYGYNTTSYTDNKGRKNVYQFNDFGNTISVTDSEGRASYYKYGEVQNKNKLTVGSNLQNSIMNYVLNHNLEYKEYWDYNYWGQSKGSMTYDTTNSYYGSQSIKLNKSNLDNSSFMSQVIRLEKGKTYTFSGYIKTLDVSNSKKGAAVFINYYDNNGDIITKESDYITGTNDWQRKEVTFTLPSDATSNTVYIRAGIMEATGTSFFDGMQVEDGNSTNRYNLVENPNFAYNTEMTSKYWSANGYDSSNQIVQASSTDNYPQKMDSLRSIYKMGGDPTVDKNIYQTVNVKGKKGDIYVAGAWGKAQSVNIKDNRYFALDVGIERLDGSYQWKVISFNEDSNEWQYVADRVIADSDYKSIRIYGLYYRNVNTASFDGFQLYKEEFGQSYQYDSKGNIISTKDKDNNSSKFEYNGNDDLTKAIDPKGNEFKYEYDSNRNITKAISAENSITSFGYDMYGNAVSAKIGTGDLFTESSISMSDNGNTKKNSIDARGNVATTIYNDLKDSLDLTIDPNGNRTYYNYNEIGSLVQTKAYNYNEKIKDFESFIISGQTIGDKGSKPQKDTKAIGKDVNKNYVFSATTTDNLIYNLGINKNSGSQMIRFKPLGNTETRYLIYNEGTNNEVLAVYIANDNKVKVSVRKNDGTWNEIITSTKQVVINSNNTIALRWQNTKLGLKVTLNLNDEKLENTTADFKDFTGGKTSIGSYIDGTYFAKEI